MRDILALALVRAELCRASAAERPAPAAAYTRADKGAVSGGWRPFRRRGLRSEMPPRTVASDGSTPPD